LLFHLLDLAFEYIFVLLHEKEAQEKDYYFVYNRTPNIAIFKKLSILAIDKTNKLSPP